MVTLKKLGLLVVTSFLLGSAPIQAAYTPLCMQGMKLTHDTGNPHYHGDSSATSKGSGRIRSYEYCNKNVFEPCRKSGGSFCYCNTQHHMCTYGHTRNCSTCC